jgi:hypothetical protein
VSPCQIVQPTTMTATIVKTTTVPVTRRFLMPGRSFLLLTEVGFIFAFVDCGGWWRCTPLAREQRSARLAGAHMVEGGGRAAWNTPPEASGRAQVSRTTPGSLRPNLRKRRKIGEAELPSMPNRAKHLMPAAEQTRLSPPLQQAMSSASTGHSLSVRWLDGHVKLCVLCAGDPGTRPGLIALRTVKLGDAGGDPLQALVAAA